MMMRWSVLSLFFVLFACSEAPSHSETSIPEDATTVLKQKRFQELDGWTWKHVSGSFGDVRIGAIDPTQKDKGSIVLLPGYSAPIEIYFETLRELRSDGFGVIALDWPSQGGSSRPLAEREKIHTLSMDSHLEAARAVLARSKNQGPFYMLASSMGGQLGTRLLAGEPDLFKAAVLITPAYGLNTQDTPEWLAKFMANLMPGENYTPGPQGWSFDPDVLNGVSACSSDLERMQLWQAWMIEKPELRIGGMTFDFLDALFESAEASRSNEILSAVQVPVFMATAGVDGYVQTPVAQQSCDVMQNCALHHYEDAKHCLLEERDAFRVDLMAKMRAFFNAHS